LPAKEMKSRRERFKPAKDESKRENYEGKTKNEAGGEAAT
jgi:hypothetical protein